MVRSDSSDLILVPVLLPRDDGRSSRSSVSLDGYLFALLARVAGGEDAAMRWIKAEAAVQAQGRESSPKAGLSRLVQRSVMRHLFDGLVAQNVSKQP